jgi:AraC family transcriptional regulator
METVIRREAVVHDVTIRLASYEPNATLPLHRHENMRFVILLRGGLCEDWGERRFECDGWSMIVRPASILHSNRVSSKGSECISIDFGPGYLKRFESLPPFDFPRMIRTPFVSAVGQRVRRELSMRDQASNAALEALALEVLVHANRTQDKSQGKRPSWLRKAEDLLRSAYCNPLSLSEIAATVGVHPVSLARSFRKHFGCTVGEYIRRLRLERACRQLASGEISIAQIALETGFSDQSHFSRVFRDRTGMTPGQYREQTSSWKENSEETTSAEIR